MIGAHRIMSKIYAFAKPEEVDLKVCAFFCSCTPPLTISLLPSIQVKVLHSSVQRSIEITNTTTFLQRLQLTLFNGINRRALSMHPIYHTFERQ